MKLSIILTVAASLISNIHAFGSFKFPSVASKPASIDPNAAEAVEIYNERYTSKKTFSSIIPNSFGLPVTDFDGTKVSSDKPNTKLFSEDDKERTLTFQAIASLYGSEEALEMTRAQPGILAFDKKNFKPALEAFSEVFGEEEAKGMVMRNPGLLYVKPENAATADDLTMNFSYVIAITRPVGPVLLYGVLALLCVPVLEGITGVSKVEFAKSVGLLSFLF